MTNSIPSTQESDNPDVVCLPTPLGSRVWLCISGWIPTHHPPVSISAVLGSQACDTIPDVSCPPSGMTMLFVGHSSVLGSYTGSEWKGKPCFVAFASVCGVNITLSNKFKLKRLHDPRTRNSGLSYTIVFWVYTDCHHTLSFSLTVSTGSPSHLSLPLLHEHST